MAAGFLGAIPLFLLMNHTGVLFAQLGQGGLAVIIGLFIGSQGASLVESSPRSVRW